jgi:tripartite-type tricarboxylate transporter receptor subunit TctC
MNLRTLMMYSVAVTAAAAAPAWAADPFYKGKTVTIVTSTGAGGQYDTIARAVARYMKSKLEGNPTIIVQNMPGGGNLLATNYMFNIAPKDGTQFATLHNSQPMQQALGVGGVRFDARKFNWLGSTGSENSSFIVWHTAGVKGFDDLLKKEITVGATGAGSSLTTFPAVMNNVLGTKLKIVSGYRSSPEINIAIERGEVQSRAFGLGSLFAEYGDRWVKAKKIVFAAQIGLKRDKRVPDVPTLVELAKTQEAKDILKFIAAPTALGKPYTAPPDLPAERVKTLRTAFAATMADKAFNAEMTKLRIDLDPMSAEETTEVVMGTVNASPAVVAEAKKVMPKKGKKKKKKKE